MRHLLLRATVLVAWLTACGGSPEDEASSGGQSGKGGSGATGATAGSSAPGAGRGGRANAGGTAGSGTGGAGGAGGAIGASGRASGGASGAGGAGGNGGAGVGGSQAGRGGSSAGVGGNASGRGGGSGSGGANPSGGAGGTSGMAGAAGAPTGEPGVRIVGRTEEGTDGLRFSWPGVSFAARFTGTQASILLADANNKNEFEVIVDGEVKDKIVTTSGETEYPLATGLAEGTHEVLVWRRTEAYVNPTEFLGITGFSSGGELLAPPSPKPHRIEVIGDSITAGYGNEGVPSCTQTTSNSNNYLAYASVAARAVNADLVTLAWSGIGMYRNYNQAGPSADAMPARYDRAVPTESDSTWDFSRFDPEVLVINLGTNDYSTMGDPGQPFVDAYVSFLDHVHTKYPDAYIVCLIQQTNSDQNIDAAVAAHKAGGNVAIEAFDINVSEGGDGCDGHPNVAKDAAMGAKLATELERVMGW